MAGKHGGWAARSIVLGLLQHVLILVSQEVGHEVAARADPSTLHTHP